MSETNPRGWKKDDDESVPELLFVTHEYPSRRTIKTIYGEAAEEAAKEKKIAVLFVPDEQRGGNLVVVREADFVYLAAEYVAGLDRDGRDAFDELVEEMRARERSGRLRVAAEGD